MRYRKKPVVIEAMQFDGTYQSAKDILNWGDATVHKDTLITLAIQTLEGRMTVLPGDWVIKGIAGEFYPCKPDIFEITYEPVEEAAHVDTL